MYLTMLFVEQLYNLLQKRAAALCKTVLNLAIGPILQAL